LVLITIDCLRADHVGHFGYARPTTPFLDSVAQQSTVFRHATVAGAPTYYSLPGLLASRYPLALGRDVIGLAPEESTIAAVLREFGFATAAFTAGNPYISARFGYDQGFDTFCDFLRGDSIEQFEGAQQAHRPSRANRLISHMCHSVPTLGAAYDELYFRYCQQRVAEPNASLDGMRRFPSAETLVEHAIEWLSENSSRPFFLWLHLMDPHAPYYPKSEALQCMGDGNISATDARYFNSYWNRSDLSQSRLEKKRDTIVKLYDAGIRWADEQIRRLASQLTDLNAWDDCVLAVTADHGEEFLDHGGRFHSPANLREALIHVPLLVRAPGVAHAEVEQAISLIDLAPTLLDILGIPSPADFRGRSYRPNLEKPAYKHPVVTEAVYGCSNPFRAENRNGPRILAIKSANYKLVINFSSGAEDFFDLTSDPHERNPLPSNVASSTRKELLEYARKHLAESHKSRDFDRRSASILRDLTLEWAHPAHIAIN
jgi:arylsulfatase A-like enzyme